MSKQLVKMVTTARPALMAAAQVQLIALRADLASMPPAAVLGDGHAEMLRLIDDVSMSIQVRTVPPAPNSTYWPLRARAHPEVTREQTVLICWPSS